MTHPVVHAEIPAQPFVMARTLTAGVQAPLLLLPVVGAHTCAVGSVRFDTTLVPRGQGPVVVLHPDQVTAVGQGAKRFPVRATVNGYTWRTSVFRMGGEFMVGLNRDVRKGAGVDVGDRVKVELVLDQAPREVAPPGVLVAALARDKRARTAFDTLSYTRRKEYAQWIREAKRPETRERRLARLLEQLRAQPDQKSS